MSKILGSIKKVFGLKSQTSNMVNPDVILNAGSQVLRSMKAHTPMIKFRGGIGAYSGHVAASSPSPTPKTSVVQPKPTLAEANATLEAWELPSRYRRRQISDEEVEYINRGGPA